MSLDGCAHTFLFTSGNALEERNCMRDRLAHIYSAIVHQGKASGLDLWNADPARANSSLAGMWEQTSTLAKTAETASFEAPGDAFLTTNTVLPPTRSTDAQQQWYPAERIPVSQSTPQQLQHDQLGRGASTHSPLGTPISTNRVRADSAMSTASSVSTSSNRSGIFSTDGLQVNDPLRPKLGPDSESQTSTGIALQTRVVVNQRCGVLRYVGNVHFEPGEWCGIELDSPSGKNNGSVGKLTYFVCEAKHGLFAPVEKVIKEPQQRGKNRSLL